MSAARWYVTVLRLLPVLLFPVAVTVVGIELLGVWPTVAIQLLAALMIGFAVAQARRQSQNQTPREPR